MEKITARQNTYLKKRPIQSSELLQKDLNFVKVNTEFPVEKYHQDINNHIKVELGYNAGTWFFYAPHWDQSWEEKENDHMEKDEFSGNFFTEEMFKFIMPIATKENIIKFIDPINKTLYNFNIATKKRAAAFIAQIAHESGSLKYQEEIASGAAYEGRRDLGNTQSGDGKRYKGRGLIQLTGRANYRTCGKSLGLDLENKPELVVKDPYINAAVAGWYWQSRNINVFADAGNFEKVTRLINGGVNGYQDRLQFWERAKMLFANPNDSFLPLSAGTIKWNDFNAQVSKYFTVREVTNGDRRRIPQTDDIKQNVFTLAHELDKVREAWGSPVLVNSWYRPPAINRAVGGASNSQHLYGKAADIRPTDNKRVVEFQTWLDKKAWKDKALGYGARKGFVHVDLRPGKIRWNY